MQGMRTNRRRTITGKSHKTSKMVNPKELMIGNICISDQGEICSPAIIEIDEINDLNPIPLSAQVMDACGFYFKHNNCWQRPDGYWLFWQKEKDDVLDVGWYWGEQYIKITYLHELQNLLTVTKHKPLEIDLQKLKNAIQ